ncbi:MAG: ABC transporter substrate-binding protein [Lachnospiraceae bacterium]|nr:ABC transporter substrate-binding protein [Lachnospiraceae bacterium]
MKKRVIGSVLAAAVSLSAVFGTCAVSATESKDLTTVNLAYNPNTGSILSFIAIDEGFAEEEGLELNLQTFDNSTDALTAVSAGKSDVGINFGTAAPLSFISNGGDLTIFGGYVMGGMPVYANADFEYKDLSSFVGKTVAVPRMYTPDLIWRQAMIEAGYDLEKDVKIVEFKKPSEVLAAVQAKKVDVGVGTNSTYMKAVESGLKILTWTNELEPDAVCCRQVANTKWFKENPEIAEKYTRTLIKAEKFLNEKPEESVKIFQKYMEMEEKDAKTLLLDTYQNFESDPNSDGVLAMWDTMCKIDYVENKDTDVKSHIDIATYKAAMDSIIAENPDDKFYSGLTERYENWNKEMLKQ